MKKRIYCIIIALCIVFAAGCSKEAKSSAVLPEVRNNGTAIQWKYVGEEEWRDLVALDSLRGAAGENGKDGIDGKDGINGLTPRIGDNGNWWIGDTDTGIWAKGVKGDTGAQGEKGDKGDKGDTGATGKDGKDGVTPLLLIGKDNIWRISYDNAAT